MELHSWTGLLWESHLDQSPIYLCREDLSPCWPFAFHPCKDNQCHKHCGDTFGPGVFRADQNPQSDRRLHFWTLAVCLWTRWQIRPESLFLRHWDQLKSSTLWIGSSLRCGYGPRIPQESASNLSVFGMKARRAAPSRWLLSRISKRLPEDLRIALVPSISPLSPAAVGGKFFLIQDPCFAKVRSH